MNKTQLIGELKKRNIKFNSKDTKAKLEELLKPALVEEINDGMDSIKDELIANPADNLGYTIDEVQEATKLFADASNESKISLGETNPSAKLHVVGGVTEEEFLVDKYEASYMSKGRIHILGMYATAKDAEKALKKRGAHIRYIKFKDR